MNMLIIFGAKYLIYVLIVIAAAYVLMQEKKHRLDILIFAIMVLPLSYIFAKVFSFLYYDPRPFVVGNFVPLIPHAADNGFPSDHTLLSSAIAAAVFPFDKKMGTLLFVLAVLVGLSRVAAGVHHAVDVFGSIIIAALVAYVTYRWIMPKIAKKTA